MKPSPSHDRPARHTRVISIEFVGNLGDSNVLVDELSPVRRRRARHELRLLALAFKLLPPRCGDVVWLRKVEGLSRNEVAARLQISVRTVEFQVQKGVRLLAQALFGEDRASKGPR